MTAKSNLSSIRQVILQLLRDEFNPDVTSDFKEDEIDVHIATCLFEVSEASPYKAFEPVLATANSKLLDISSLEDLIKVTRVEHKVGGSPRNFRNVNFIDSQTIEIDADSVPSTTGTSGVLAGTVTFTSGSATVTGSGTAFTTALAQNYYIKPSTKSRWYRVYSVESTISLTLDEPVKSEDAGADTVNVTQYRYEVALVYYEKLHTLTEERSTLNAREESALVLGVCGHAAISKSRSLINMINEGGGGTPANMQNWGLTKLQLYQQALRRFPPQTKVKYPTS